MANITCKKVSTATKDLLDCKNPFWQAEKELIETTATPLANQPSPYIKGVYSEDKIGAVKKIWIKSVHNAESIFFYFEWESGQPNLKIQDINVFADGIALLMPMKEIDKTPISEMGTKDYPTTAWYWRPDFEDKPKNQVAHGLSTSLYTEKSSVASSSKWENGKWQVVMGRTLKANRPGEETVDLAPGTKIGIGFAVWEGSNGERGGVKAFSKEWRDLVIEA
jgi:complex iron-sulfur molybdoenzyme family reductase subunit gamma